MNCGHGEMTDNIIRQREELADQIKALNKMKEMALIYGFDISVPAVNAAEAVQWLYFGYLAAIKTQNGAAMSVGRISTFLDIYIQRDLDEGTITEKEAQELIDHLVMKFRMVKFARIPSYNQLFSGDPVWATLEMAGIDTDVRRTFATGIAGFSHVVDSLSAIRYAKVRVIRDEEGISMGFETEGDFPRYGNDDDRADDIAVWLLKTFPDSEISRLPVNNDRNDDEHRQKVRIVQERDDLHGRDSRKARCDEELSAVGDDSLCNAGAGVKERRGLDGRDLVLLTDLLCNWSRQDDCDRVVRSRDIDEDSQQADPDHAAPLAAEVNFDKVEDSLESAVLIHERADGRDEDRDDDRLEHTGTAGSHRGESRHEGEAVRQGADDHEEHNTGSENDEYVDSDERHRKNDEIGERLRNAVLEGADPCFPAYDRIDDQDDKCDNGCRQGNSEIGTEFVFHFHALSLGRGDRRIGNERQIIAEHRSSDDCSDAERQVETAVLRYGDCDRSEHGDRADAGSHGHGDQAGDEEQARDREFAGYDAEKQIRGACGAARFFRDTAEASGDQENEDHDRDILIADSFRADLHFIVEADFPVLQKSDDERDHEGHDDGHDVESHLAFDRVNVLEVDSDAQVKDKEDDDRQQSDRIWFFLFHNGFPLLIMNLQDGAVGRHER